MYANFKRKKKKEKKRYYRINEQHFGHIEKKGIKALAVSMYRVESFKDQPPRINNAQVLITSQAFNVSMNRQGKLAKDRLHVPRIVYELSRELFE